MKVKMIFVMAVTLVLSTILLAQNEDGIKEKIAKIEGNANEIVITTDKGKVVFKGEEAKALLKKIKSKSRSKKLKWISKDGNDFDLDGENVMILKSDNNGKHIVKKIKGNDHMIMLKESDIDDIDIMDNGKMINVKVEEENGEKKVTVTTSDNGKDKVETYAGEEADEYLEKMEKENDIEIDIDSDDDIVWINKEDFDGDNVEKEVKVSVDNGNKLVTVKTTKDGKETVKTYKGKEADEYLEKLKKEDKMKIEEKIINGKKFKKIIIKEIEDEDEK